MKKPILIQGAMDVETQWMVSQLGDVNHIVIGSYHFWQGEYQGKSVVVNQTEIGTISCASSTTVGILQFQPSVIINQGIAGGHRRDLQVGDIVVGETCIHINNLKTPLKGEGEGFDASQWEYHITDDNQNVPTVYKADAQWVERFYQADYQGKKVLGRLGSGDIYNREIDRIDWTVAWAETYCEDMESVATYQVCAQFGVPCIGLRILSNNELTGQPYQREMGERLQQFVWDNLL